jgi:hypothetical protein
MRKFESLIPRSKANIAKQLQKEVLERDGSFYKRETDLRVKNPGASPEAFKNMNSPYDEKPKQASGYQTQRESKQISANNGLPKGK